MAIVVSGTAFASDRSTPLTGTTRTVELRVNGISPQTVETVSGTGIWSFAAVTAVAGDTITILLLAETEKANTITVADGTTNITSVELSDDHFIIQNNNAGSTTIADLASYDNDDNAIDMLFTANAGVLTTEAGRRVVIASGNSFAPGGNTTLGTPTVGGTSLILEGIFIAANGETLTFNRADLNATGGTYTRATTDKIVATGNSDILWTAGGITITDLDVTMSNSPQRAISITGILNVAGTLTMTTGRLDGSGKIILTGNSSVAAAFGFVGTANDLVIEYAGTGAQAATNSGGIHPGMTINKSIGTLTFTGSDGDNRFDVMKPFVYTTGTVDFTTNTVRLALRQQSGGNQTFTANGIALHDLELNSGSNHTVSGIANVANNLFWLDGNIKALTARETDRVDVTGNVTKTGGGAANLDNTGTIKLTGTGTQAISMTAGVWCSLIIDKAGGSATFTGDNTNKFTMTGLFTFTAGTVDFTTNTVRLVFNSPSGSGTFRNVNGNGVNLHALEFDMLGGRVIIGVINVANDFFGTDGTIDAGAGDDIRISGNMTIAAAFGPSGTTHDALISLVGALDTTLINTSLGIIPKLALDKTLKTTRVTVSGTGTIETSDDFAWKKGTLATPLNLSIGGVSTVSGLKDARLSLTGTAIQTISLGGPSPQLDIIRDEKTGGSISFAGAFDANALESVGGGAALGFIGALTGGKQ